MAKRKASKPKRRWFSRKHRKRTPKTVPFEVLIAAGTIPFTPATNGSKSILGHIQDQNWDAVGKTLKTGFLGIDYSTDQFDIFGMINPMDMEHGRFTKTLIIAGLIGMIRKKLSGKYTAPLFRKIPFIGRWVS